MPCGITSSRLKKCRDIQAGFDIVYLFPFVKYGRSEIDLTGNVLDAFPSTNIYKFNILNPSLTEQHSEDGGGKFYDQNLSFDLSKVGIVDNLELPRLTKKDYRAIVLDRNGLYRIVGLWNGLITDLNKVTGESKDAFNGYKISMEGKEASSSVFITDLEDAGFIIAEDNFLLLEDGSFILLENNERVTLE